MTALRDELTRQRDFLADRSPAYHDLAGLLLDALDEGLLARLEHTWRQRTFLAWYERPLLLLAALRDDALATGPSHPLWHAIGERNGPREPITAGAVAEALRPERPCWRTLATRTVQTNETSRAVAWRWPAALLHEVAPAATLRLVDIGASAGLNLVADRLPPIWTDGAGAPLPVSPQPPVIDRTGFDQTPLDVRDRDDARWLRACVWPDQPDRLARLDAALTAFQELDPSEIVVRACSAGDVPAALPMPDASGSHVLAYQTVVRDYIPQPERQRYRDGMRDWVRRSPPARALWVELELADGGPAAIDVHLRDEDQPRCLRLATCEPHPRSLDVDHAEVAALQGILRRHSSGTSQSQ